MGVWEEKGRTVEGKMLENRNEKGALDFLPVLNEQRACTGRQGWFLETREVKILSHGNQESSCCAWLLLWVGEWFRARGVPSSLHVPGMGTSDILGCSLGSWWINHYDTCPKWTWYLKNQLKISFHLTVHIGRNQKAYAYGRAVALSVSFEQNFDLKCKTLKF